MNARMVKMTADFSFFFSFQLPIKTWLEKNEMLNFLKLYLKKMKNFTFLYKILDMFLAYIF